MKLKFQSKEESNRQKQEAFLKLTPSERVVAFFRLMEQLKGFPAKKQRKNNFVININD